LQKVRVYREWILIKQQIKQWFYLKKLRFYQFLKKYPYCYNYDHLEQCCVCQWCQDGMPCKDLIFPPLFDKSKEEIHGFSMEHYIKKEVPSSDR